MEHLRDFLELPLRFLGAEVNGRAHPSASHFEGLFDVRETNLIVAVWIREEFIVIEFEQKRNLVRVLPRHRAEHTERRRDGIATSFYRELDKIFRVEIDRIGSEGGAGGVFDALIDGQYRYIAGFREPSRAKKLLQADQCACGAVGSGEDSIDKVGSG